MADTLAEARANVHAAALAREDLLRRAVENEAVTDDEMLAADDAHERAERILKLEEAKAVGAHQRAEQSAIVALTKKANELNAAHDAAIDKRIEAASRCDELYALLQNEMEHFHRAGLEVSATVSAMVSHNAAVERALPVHNKTLAALPSAQRPRCRRVEAGSLPTKPDVKISVLEGFGWDRKVHEIHSLEARERTAWSRPHLRENAA